MLVYRLQSRWRAWLPERAIEFGLVSSIALFFFIPPPVSWVFLGAAAVLAWVRLPVAIALLPLTFPYYLLLKPLTSHPFPAFNIGELSLLICLAVALGRTVLLPTHRRATWQWVCGLWRQTRPLALPALLFLLGATLALLVSPDRHLSVRAYRDEMLEPFLYCLLILRYLRTRTDLARTITALVLSALFLAVIGIFQGVFQITSGLLYISPTTFRVFGPSGNSNNLSFTLERALPILLALSLTHVLRRPPQAAAPERPVWRDPLRWACLLVTVPVAWGLYWTYSRGAEVGLAVVLVVFFVLEVRRWVVVVPVLGGGALGVALFWSRILHLFDQGHATISERFLLWKAALLIIRDHLLLGTGLDSFNTQYNPNAPNSYALKALDGQPFPEGYNPGLSHPHTMFLDLWISTGLLGLAGFFWLLGAFATVVVRVYRLCASLGQGTLLQRLVLGLGGSMLIGVVHGLVDNAYFLPDLALMFWFFVGTVLVVQGIAQGKQSFRQQETPPVAPMALPVTGGGR